MRRKNQKNISLLTDTEVYFRIITGEFKKFPNNFLNKTSCKNILRYICIDMYHMSRTEICHVNQDFLFKNYVGGFRKIFNYDVFSLVQYSFPELDIKRWEASKVSANFWQDEENQKDFILWIAQKENLDLNKLEDVSKINSRMIIQYGGSRARRSAGGTFELISTVTGDTYKEWEVLKIDTWTETKAITAIKWLIEDVLCWSDEQVVNQLTSTTFRSNHLGGLLKNYCNNSPIAAINLAYPGKFKTLRHAKS